MFWSLDARLVAFKKLKNFFLSLSSFFANIFGQFTMVIGLSGV